MHAEMPCCATSDAVVPRDDTRQQQAISAAFTSLLPQPAMAARLDAEVTPARVQRIYTTAAQAHPEPSPPLFLLNAQFLI
jgi:hypothetical protein